LAYIQRADNAIIYVTAITTGLMVYAFKTDLLSKRVLWFLVGVSPIAVVLSLPLFRDGIAYLAKTRMLRARGRAIYLSNTIPKTVGEFVAFSWVGAVYFLYAPFPWMIGTIPGVLIGIEGLFSIGYTIAALLGIRLVAHRNTPVAAALFIGFAIGAVLYGIGTANYGAAMRHRQMFIWVVFLFGGIALAEKLRITKFLTR
jgi:hypothetical protein